MRKLSLLLCLPLFALVCTKDTNQPGLPSQYQDFSSVFEGLGIGGIIALDFHHLLLVNTTGDRYAWFSKDEVKKEWSLRDTDGPLKNYPTTLEVLGTGMVLSWVTNPDLLFLISADGNTYTSADINGSLTASTP